MGLPVIRSGRLFFGGLCGHPVTWELGEKRGRGSQSARSPSLLGAPTLRTLSLLILPTSVFLDNVNKGDVYAPAVPQSAHT